MTGDFIVVAKDLAGDCINLASDAEEAAREVPGSPSRRGTR